MTAPIDAITVLIDKYTDKLADQRRDYETRLADWQGTCDRLAQERDDAQRRAQASIIELTEKWESIHDKALAACREERDQLRVENGRLAADCDFTATKLIEARVYAENLGQTLDQAYAERDEARAGIDPARTTEAVEALKAGAAEAAAKWNQKITELSASRDEIIRERDRLSDSLNNIRGMLKIEAERSAGWQEENQRLRAENDKLRSQTTELSEEVDEARDQVTLWERRYKQAVEANAQLQGEKSSSRRTIDAVAAERDYWQRQYTDLISAEGGEKIPPPDNLFTLRAENEKLGDTVLNLTADLGKTQAQLDGQMIPDLYGRLLNDLSNTAQGYQQRGFHERAAGVYEAYNRAHLQLARLRDQAS